MTPAPETSPAQEPALKPEELDRLEGLLADEWPSGFDPWKPFGGGAAQRSTLRALIAQARTVPPAAAPDGELREAIQAALETIRVRSVEERAAADAGVLGTIPVANHGGRRDGLIEAGRLVLAALAAAPVTGDRETAGVELAAVHKLTRPLAVDTMDEAVRVLLAQMRPDKRPTSITDESWAHHLAWVIGFDTLVEERARLHALSTPPSGGGDHAGPEAEGGAAMESATRAVWLADGGLAEDYDRALAADEEFAEDHRRWAEAAVSAYFAATARPAAAEGSAEVSCKENGGSAATTDASCKAAEPVTSGKLREAVENVVVRMSYGGVLYRSDPETKALIAALAPSTTSAASDGEGNNA